MKGLVTKLIGGQYTVLDLLTHEEIIAVARGKLRNMRLIKGSSFLHTKTDRTKVETQTIKLSPKVGDIVYCDINEGINCIIDVEERRNELARPDIANVDQAILIFSTVVPDFSTILLDRFLVLIERANIRPVIIITKMDLLDEDDETLLRETMAYYEKLYDVYYVSSKKHNGVDEVRRIFKDKISVFTGQTGAGKSTLLNSLNSNWNLKTGDVSKALGRGKHTTRHTELFELAGGMVADTPGFSSLEFGNLSPKELAMLFTDFYQASNQCRFRGCLHIDEPGCKIKEKYASGEIIPSRYENYLKLMNETRTRKLKY